MAFWGMSYALFTYDYEHLLGPQGCCFRLRA